MADREEDYEEENVEEEEEEEQVEEEEEEQAEEDDEENEEEEEEEEEDKQEEEEEDDEEKKEALNYFGEEPVRLNSDFSNVVVLDNLPVVSDEKFQKLYGVIQGKVSQYGNVQELHMPVGGDEKTLGYAFVVYAVPELAQVAVSQLNGFKLDKTHILRANLFTDFEMLENLSDEFEIKDMGPQSKEDKFNFLLDERARDQYIVRYDRETEIYWNDSQIRNNNGRELVNGGEVHKKTGMTWTRGDVAWSSKGTYLATFHDQGIALWAGDSFDKLGRVSHRHPKEVSFSPNESYMITYSDVQEEGAIVWSISTWKALRDFEKGEKLVWSYDDKYVARSGKNRKGQDSISIYELPEMTLLEKKSIEVQNVKDVYWSPKANLISYWVPEEGSTPCRVTVMEIPSRNVVRETHMFNVSDMTLHWHNDGSLLCAKILRKNKKTGAYTTVLEVFRMREKNVPIDNLEIEGKAVSFEWEPNGTRFAVLLEGSNNIRATVGLYEVTKKKIEHLKNLDSRAANRVLWSPEGSILLLAGLENLNGVFEFFDVNTMTTLANREHFRCTFVTWDPTGRFVISAVTHPLTEQSGYKSFENGYKVWSFDPKGDHVFSCTTEVSYERCYRVLWRPRVPCPLPKDKQKAIASRLSKKDQLWTKLENEDEDIQGTQISEEDQRKRRLRRDWREYETERQKRYTRQTVLRTELRGGVQSDDDDDYKTITEQEEIVLEENTKVIH